MTGWDHTKWGEWSDPIHKSDLNGIVGKFGCLSQFRRKKDDRARGTRPRYERASGHLISGNAVHAVIARVLRSEPARTAVLAGVQLSRASLLASFDVEFDKFRKGRDVDWYKLSSETHRYDCVSMLEGVMRDMHKHVGEVVLVEAGFIYRLGDVWLTGMTDIVYRAPGSARICLADWKTSKQRPNQIELDHGWEGGIYAGALRDAIFVPGESVEADAGEEHRDAMERVCIRIAQMQHIVSGLTAGQITLPGLVAAQSVLDGLILDGGAKLFGEYPERIRHVHMRDYIPYTRAVTKKLTRPEELEWAGLQRPGKVKFVKGDQRGPAWLRVQRAESDIPRLRSLIDAVVRWVRRGDFVAAPGEMCTRCSYRQPCLNDGYMPIGEELVQLDTATKGLQVDGLDGLQEI